MTIADHLPSVATPFELAMAETLDVRERLHGDIPPVKTIGIQAFPADWLPWLVLHYGLEEIAPVIGDLLRTLVEGKPWQRVRGTPAATEAFVLGWLGLEGLDVPDGYGGAGPIEEERVGDAKWWLYQIALQAPPATLAKVADLIRADALSKNAGTRLGRVYAGYDVRPIRLDGGRLDDGLLDDWSGVVLQDLALKGMTPHLSFGRGAGGTLDAAVADPPTSISIEVAGLARFDGGFVLDRSRLDGEVLDLAIAQLAAGFASDGSEHITLSGGAWPRAAWPGLAWKDFSYFVYGGAD